MKLPEGDSSTLQINEACDGSISIIYYIYNSMYCLVWRFDAEQVANKSRKGNSRKTSDYAAGLLAILFS